MNIFRLTILLFVAGGTLMAQQREEGEPQQLVFKDDGAIPNNTLPLLLYRQAFAADTTDFASVIEQRFAENDWTGSWRAGVYPLLITTARRMKRSAFLAVRQHCGLVVHKVQPWKSIPGT